MTEIPEARLRQFLRLARMLGAVAVTRADTAQHLRLAGYPELAADVEAAAVVMARDALSAVVFLLGVLDDQG